MKLKQKETGKFAQPKARFKAGKERLLDSQNMDSYWRMLYSLLEKYGPSTGMCELVADAKAKYLKTSIDPANWNTKIVVPANLSFRSDKLLERFLWKMSIKDPFGELISDVGKHEFGHWELPRGSGFGCPMDNKLHHELFLQPVFEELMESGKFSEGGCKGWARRIVNAVEDIIDNYNVFVNSRAGTIGNGQVLFWYLAGQAGGTYSSEYTMFVKCNLMFMRNRGEATGLLGQFFAKYGQDNGRASVGVEKEIGESVSRLRGVLTHEKLLDKGSWEEIARAYAKEVIKFIDDVQEPEQPMSGGDNTAKEGEPGEEEESESGEGGSGQEEEESSGSEEEEEDEDPFGKLTPKDVEDIMRGRKDAGKGVPFYLDHDVALDGVYNALSRRVRVKTRHGDLPTAECPVVATRRRAYDLERDELSGCDMSRVVVDPITRRVVPTVVTHWHNVDIPIRKTLRGFPGVAFALVDASGTMMRGGDCSMIPWGDESGYHYALLAFYGLLRQLEYLGVMHKVDVSGAIFHTDTTAATGLDNVKKMLLSPTTGETNVDMDIVRKMLAGKSGALFPFISDGGIINWDSVKEEFIELAKKQQFFMVLIGSETNASRDIEAAGLVVKRVDSYEDVVGLVVDLTAKAYSRTIREKMEREALNLQR